jgi:hypothetical protein
MSLAVTSPVFRDDSSGADPSIDHRHSGSNTGRSLPHVEPGQKCPGGSPSHEHCIHDSGELHASPWQASLAMRFQLPSARTLAQEQLQFTCVDGLCIRGIYSVRFPTFASAVEYTRALRRKPRTLGTLRMTRTPTACVVDFHIGICYPFLTRNATPD